MLFDLSRDEIPEETVATALKVLVGIIKSVAQQYRTRGESNGKRNGTWKGSRDLLHFYFYSRLNKAPPKDL